jgi:H+/gluconate symporter-like permease
MALDTFVFTVTLPPRPESVALFREISAHMSRYIGLGATADVPGTGDPISSALVSTRREGGVLRLRLTWEPDGDE